MIQVQRSLRTIVRVGLFVFTLTAAGSATEPAAACAASAGRPAATGTPIRVPLGPGDLGVLPEACEATEASLESRAGLLVATTDLYGSLQAGVGVRGRRPAVPDP